MIFQSLEAFYDKILVEPLLGFLVSDVLPGIMKSFQNKGLMQPLLQKLLLAFAKTLPRKTTYLFFVKAISLQLGIVGVLLLLCVLGISAYWKPMLEAKPSKTFVYLALISTDYILFELGRCYGVIVVNHPLSFSFFCFFLSSIVYTLFLLCAYVYSYAGWVRCTMVLFFVSL